METKSAEIFPSGPILYPWKECECLWFSSRMEGKFNSSCGHERHNLGASLIDCLQALARQPNHRNSSILGSIDSSLYGRTARKPSLWESTRSPRGDSTGNFLDFSSAASFRQQRFFVSSEYSSAAIFQRRDFVVRNSSEGVIKSSISLFIIPIQFLFTYSCRYVDMFKDGLLLSSYSSLFERPVFGNTLIFLDFECMANSITLMCKLDIA